MGVPGLWDLLRPAAGRTSLSALANEAFQANRNGLRALTIGIDASIWIFHAQIPVHGENPFLRTIFYKIATLLQQPVLPVFVFDGPNKPSHKRNERVAGQFGTYDWRSRKFKELLDVCGLEWWNAPGEAEAELAVMNRQGKIDAVLSDDVDALLFGAKCLLRNNSPTLSGAQASSTQSNSSRGDLRHYEVYRSSVIRQMWTEKEGTALSNDEDCRMAMVLVAMLSGGDYAPEGLTQFGATISFALANAGHSEFLKLYTTDHTAFDTQLSLVHGKMVDELRTNSTGYLGRRYPDRAGKLASRDPSSLFPAFALEAYLKPCTSPLADFEQGWPGFGQGAANSRRGKGRNDGRGDIEGMARACEKYFEWGTKEIVAKKFASESVGIFGGEVMNEARARVQRARQSTSPSAAASAGPSRITWFFQQSVDELPSKSSKSTLTNTEQVPSHIIRIHSVRKDPTNSEQNEYRISYRHDIYVARCHGAMQGTRCDPTELSPPERASLGLVDRYEDVEPSASQLMATKTEIRVWLPEYLVRAAWPKLVAAYEEELKAKVDKAKSPRQKIMARTVVRGKTGQRKGSSARGEDAEKFVSFFTQRPPSPRNSSPEAVEEVENRPPQSAPTSSSSPTPRVRSPRRTKIPLQSAAGKRNSQARPSSSLSSAQSQSGRNTDSPPTLFPPCRMPSSSSTPSAVLRRTRPRAKALRIASSSPSQLSSRHSSSADAANKGKKDEPIDLCSTDDELPPPPRRGSRQSSQPSPTLADSSRSTTVFASSSRANALPLPPKRTSPRPQSRTVMAAAATSKEKAAVPLSQTRLGIPVVSRSTATMSSLPEQAGKDTKQLERSIGAREKVRSKPRVSYSVTYEDDEVEEIDSSRHSRR